jgi:hypothetical protein
MTLNHIKVIERVFTATQKRELVERRRHEHEQLAVLVYELLDAHADTDRLVRGPSTDLVWGAHLDYLRALQRTGREILAHGADR